ncbi:MAG: DUF4395 domain-containing protein [bacterium]
MKGFNDIICPVSPDRLDENRVRVTALGVVFIMGAYFATGFRFLPAILVVDFYLRAFTRMKYSPLSYMSYLLVKAIDAPPVLIDKAPKMFAARIGLVLTRLITMAVFLNWNLLAYITGSVLIIFAFLECGLNFCMGCWLYTYVVFPLARKSS